MTDSPIAIARQIVLQIIASFPISRNGHAYLTLKNGKKVFFQIFIKKYGIDGSLCKYNDSDVLRRIRIVEFLDHLTKHYEFLEQETGLIFLKTHFYTLIIKEICTKKGSRWEFLSIYPHI